MKGAILMAVVLALTTVQAMAGPIDPLGFTSLGSFTTSGSNTTYTINTSGTPTLTLPGGGTINGVVYADTPGHNLAVFDFSSINVAAGTMVAATGSLPLVLLSQGNVIIGGTINASGATYNFPSNTSVGGPGGGGGFSPASGPGAGFGGGFSFGGGGFGGGGAYGGIYKGINGSILGPAPGGPSYGNLSVSLQGGSAGGSFSYDSGGGAGGGGALEIGATGALHLLGTAKILADGGSVVGTGVLAGGGSGGGIFLHGNSVNLDAGGLISAMGGQGSGGLTVGGPQGGSGGGGGGGGGGRVLVAFGSGGGTYTSSSFNVSGGMSGYGSVLGGPGQITFGTTAFVTPEPSSLVLSTLGFAAAGALAWRRRSAA